MARWTADRAVDKIRDRSEWEAVELRLGAGPFPLGPQRVRELAEKDL